MHRQRKMIHLGHILVGTCLIVAMGSALAVQDPKASAAQLDSRIAAIKGEIAKVDNQLANPKLPSNDRKVLQAKRASLATEQRSLAQDRVRNAKTSENPMVVYSDDTPASADADRIDGLFK